MAHGRKETRLGFKRFFGVESCSQQVFGLLADPFSHVGKAACQAPDLIAAIGRQFGVEIPTGHAVRGFGQNGQTAGDHVIQQHPHQADCKQADKQRSRAKQYDLFLDGDQMRSDVYERLEAAKLFVLKDNLVG